jgi:hypothetical protein
MAQLLAEAAEETTEVAKRLLGMMDADKTVISTSVADHEVETEFDGGTGDEEAGSGVEAGAAEVVEAADAAEAAEAAEVKVAFEAGCVLEDDSEESTDVEGKEGEAGGAGSANLEFEVALPAGSKLGIGFTHNDTHATHGKIGCKVTTVQAESAAAKSGKILPHDWLLAVNGTDVSHDNKQGVIRVIKVAMALGEPVTMRFRREAMDAVSKVSARGEEGREEDDMEIVVRCLDTGEQHDVQHLNRQVMSARKHSVSRIHQETAGLAEAASLFHRFLSISDFGGNRGNRGTGPHDADAFWPSIPHRRRRVLENHEGTGGGERGGDRGGGDDGGGAGGRVGWGGGDDGDVIGVLVGGELRSRSRGGGASVALAHDHAFTDDETDGGTATSRQHASKCIGTRGKVLVVIIMVASLFARLVFLPPSSPSPPQRYDDRLYRHRGTK